MPAPSRKGQTSQSLNATEREVLLRLARESIANAVAGTPLPALDRAALSPALLEDGATFVTLTIDDMLRGCIGTLEAHQPLADDVREHAIAAAFEDPRFPPLHAGEFGRIRIEVSRLTRPQPLEYSDSSDLLKKLRPNIDGVLLRDGALRATFLPQVWEKIPDPADFLDQLCLKMGRRKDAWRTSKLQVYIYQVEEFHEP